MAAAAVPAGFEGQLESARARHRSGHVAEAAEVYRRLNRDHPEHPEPWHLLAVVAHQQGAQEHSATLAREAIARAPDCARYHNTLGNALRLLGQGEDAEAAFAAACRLEPEVLLYSANLAVALLDRGAAADALALADRALRAAPGEAGLLNIQGLALQALDRLEESLAAFDAAVAAAPDSADAHTNRRVSLLKLQRFAGAAEAARSWLSNHAADRDALTHLAAALAGLGQERALADLVRLDQHVRPVEIRLGSGRRPDSSFNAVLVRHCLEHPTLQSGRHNKATAGGSQTDDLTAGAPPELTELLASLDQAARRLANAHCREGRNHLWAGYPPAAWRLRVWATVLLRGGHQRPHTHPAGWMSGVYYVDVPASAGTADGRAGWIEFGRPDAELGVADGFSVRDIEPVPGTAVLFPSFVWHRTHPFAGEKPRISIAFDFIPQS